MVEIGGRAVQSFRLGLGPPSGFEDVNTLVDPASGDAVPPVFEMPEHPDDAPSIDLAAASADRLLANDKHLLGLMNPATDGGRRLKALLPALVIETPEAFVARLAS